MLDNRSNQPKAKDLGLQGLQCQPSLAAHAHSLPKNNLYARLQRQEASRNHSAL